jgi:hypothetical protein
MSATKSSTSFVPIASKNVSPVEDNTALPAIQRDAQGAKINKIGDGFFFRNVV